TMAMKFLRSGASATDAVEAALRVLEDKEITNAGYGSNLSIDGTVECDATIVDHLGRSGACGAVPNVRNPICLAKLILDKSKQPMTLRRVPPNILVGDGARNFAVEHGMLVVPNESLISKNSRDRFLHWQDDLRRADERLKQGGESQKVYGPEIAPSNLASSQPHGTFLSTPTDQMRSGFPQQGDHAHAILLGTWNEGQPDSPYHGPPESECRPGASPITPLNAGLIEPRAPPPPEQCHLDSANNVNSPRGRRASPAKMSSLEVHSILESQPHERDRDGGRSPRLEEGGTRPTNEGQREPQQAPRGIKRPFPFPAGTDDAKHTMDVITDTIGAIAIDAKGTIAAGSSSGGIGMKHRGRLGPAALVGVGTAVVPCDPDDPDGVCVATVTSGTGEHMATTMASQRCAERIYRNTRRGPRGQDVQEDDEDAIMESFIKDDFMGHPGVKNCNPVGAIGLMTVKKTRGGCYLYFAHNTDSFALASMGSSDKEPQCVMSRLGDVSQVTRGARKVALE
ncbi:threonine aspartase, partial [Sodiomyces alkalinus F11]